MGISRRVASSIELVGSSCLQRLAQSRLQMAEGYFVIRSPPFGEVLSNDFH